LNQVAVVVPLSSAMRAVRIRSLPRRRSPTLSTSPSIVTSSSSRRSAIRRSGTALS
jgi:hypothetical protein